MRLFFITIFILSMISIDVQAQEVKFCDAFNSDKIYKNNASYKKLIKGKDGWVFRTKTDFGDDFKVNSALRDRFVRLNKAFQDQNIKLVIALLPTRGIMHNDYIDYPHYNFTESKKSYLELVRKLEEIGITVASTKEFSNSKDYFYKMDHHWSPEGAKKMAAAVAREIKELPVYSEVSKTSYKTDSSENIEHMGTFAKFINEICSSNIKGESIPAYKTYEAEETSSLFEDKPDADIVLLGTSNSDPNASRANFDGFLKEYISADVKNLSVSGGGADSSVISWLNSQDYMDKKPKIVIWEVPVYHNFKGSPFYRQAIPAVYGACEGKEVLQTTATIDNKNFEINDLSSKLISAKGHYIRLYFSEFNGRKFRLTSSYDNGKKDYFNFRRSKFYEPDNIYYVELDQNIDGNLSSIKAVMPDDATGSVNLSICRYPET